MVMLVNLEEAKAQVRITHDLEDDDIVLKIQAASAAVISYLKTVDFIDSSGEPDFALVPEQARQATLALVDIFVRRDPAAAEWEHGYLPPHVTALLYPLRDPAIA